MGDHFVLLVDRLLTESTLEAAIASRNQYVEAQSKTDLSNHHHRIDFEDIISTPKKIVECRICQDEDVDSNMETPCSCSGSLKYAHRRCIQRWCNEKGNTTCEICHQQFKPGYTAPPPLFRFGRIPMNLRRGSHGPRLIMVSTDRNFLHSDDEDYPTSTRNMICCRTLLIAFMVLLILRHTLPVILSGSNVISFPLIMLIFLRIAGIVIPIYVMVRVVAAIQRRFQQEPPDSGLAIDDEEAEQPSLEA